MALGSSVGYNKYSICHNTFHNIWQAKTDKKRPIYIKRDIYKILYEETMQRTIQTICNFYSHTALHKIKLDRTNNSLCLQRNTYYDMTVYQNNNEYHVATLHRFNEFLLMKLIKIINTNPQ